MVNAGWVQKGSIFLRNHPAALFLLLAIPTLIWVTFGYRGPFSYGDTGDYIKGVAIRAPLYPRFIWLHLNQWPDQVPWTADWLTTQYAWRNIMHSQLFLIWAATTYFLWTLSKIKVWAPFLAILIFIPLRLIKSHWGGVINHEIFYAILSEGIKLPWFLILNALTIWALFRPSISRFIGLGLWAYLGVEINPNTLALAGLSFAPLLLYILPKEKRKFNRALWIAPLILISFYGIRCSIEKVKGGTFSVVPFDGFTSISGALQYAEPGMENLFTDPIQKAFVAEIMANPCRIKRRAKECPEYTAFVYELEAYNRLHPGMSFDHFKVNRFFKDISSRLYSQPKVFMKWQQAIFKSAVQGIGSSPLFKIFWILCFALSLQQSYPLWKKRQEPLAALPVLYLVLYFLNIYLSTAFVVYDQRYVIFGEFLVIPALAIALALRYTFDESPSKTTVERRPSGG